jgi:hypothetical protein
LEIARKGGHGSDSQDVLVTTAAILKGRDHFLPSVKNGLRIIEGHPALFSQMQGLVLSIEQSTPQIFLQLLELNAESRLGYIQPNGGGGQGSLPNYRVKISKMVIIELIHTFIKPNDFIFYLY